MTYNGAVPRCGVVGGTYEFDYLLNFTFAAQHVADMGPTSYPATDFDQAAIDEVLWEVEPGFGQQGEPTDAGLRLENIVRTLSGGVVWAAFAHVGLLATDFSGRGQQRKSRAMGGLP